MCIYIYLFSYICGWWNPEQLRQMRLDPPQYDFSINHRRRVVPDRIASDIAIGVGSWIQVANWHVTHRLIPVDPCYSYGTSNGALQTGHFWGSGASEVALARQRWRRLGDCPDQPPELHTKTYGSCGPKKLNWIEKLFSKIPTSGRWEKNHVTKFQTQALDLLVLLQHESLEVCSGFPGFFNMFHQVEAVNCGKIMWKWDIPQNPWVNHGEWWLSRSRWKWPLETPFSNKAIGIEPRDWTPVRWAVVLQSPVVPAQRLAPIPGTSTPAFIHFSAERSLATANLGPEMVNVEQCTEKIR